MCCNAMVTGAGERHSSINAEPLLSPLPASLSTCKYPPLRDLGVAKPAPGRHPLFRLTRAPPVPLCSAPITANACTTYHVPNSDKAVGTAGGDIVGYTGSDPVTVTCIAGYNTGGQASGTVECQDNGSFQALACDGSAGRQRVGRLAFSPPCPAPTRRIVRVHLRAFRPRVLCPLPVPSLPSPSAPALPRLCPWPCVAATCSVHGSGGLQCVSRGVLGDWRDHKARMH